MPRLTVYLFLILLGGSSCTDLIDPTYQFRDGFYLIEGEITNVGGGGQISVSRSELRDELYFLSALPGARVFTVEEGGASAEWIASDDDVTYRAPEGYAGEPGRSYFVRVELRDGTVLESDPEVMPAPVPISNFRLDFEQEAFFDPVRDRFVPAHTLLVDVDDPPEVNNFYRWRYRVFRQIAVCASCSFQRYRNGRCEEHPSALGVERWDYLCDGLCWEFVRSLKFELQDDGLSQGRALRGIAVGSQVYTRPSGGRLFELSQEQLTGAHYFYARQLQQLAFESGGLNSVTPSALIGNMRDVNNPDVQVLGYFGAVAVDTARTFIRYEDVDGTPVQGVETIMLEPDPPTCGDCPPRIPCTGDRRTQIKPEGWEE